MIGIFLNVILFRENYQDKLDYFFFGWELRKLEPISEIRRLTRFS